MDVSKRDVRRIVQETLSFLTKECYLDLIDLSKVPEKELRRQYVDYRLFSNTWSIGSIFSSIAEGYTQSNAEKTEDADTVIESLLLKYGFSKKWQITKRILANNIPVIMAVADIEENFAMVDADMDKAGYFMGFQKIVNIKDMQWRILQYEPMYEFDQTNILRYYPLAYHWTPVYHLENIKKNGFVPKTENRAYNYPPRVYFLNGAAPRPEIMALGQNLCKANIDGRNDGKYALIYVSTDKIPKEFKFYYDPNMRNAMYTTDIISSDVIDKIEKYQF